MKNINIENSLKEFLPKAIHQMLISYEDFLTLEDHLVDEEKSKEFLTFHKACKAALSNIEYLLKLYALIEKEDENDLNHDGMREKIKQAEENIINNLKEIGHV